MSFAALFGRSPSVTADAPGRVNLIGEHTDYNQGFVLPTPIPQRTVAELTPRADERVRVVSASLAGEAAEYALGAEAPGRGWLDYVQGLTWALRADGALILGFDLRLTSSVPAGAGLASSAALEVAVLRALRVAFRLPLDDVELALVGQRAENAFVGARVGVMDQMAASLGVEGRALLIDTRSLEHRSVPLPVAAELLVIDSGVAHRNRAGGYNARRAECERACTLLGVTALRELAAADLPRAAALPASLGRRVRHVVGENERVRAALAALEAGDVVRLGALFDASHVSLRDDYEVSTPEVDRLVAMTRAQPETLGARLTGGGFGGAIVALVRPGAAAAVGERVTRGFTPRTGTSARVLVPPPGAGT
ncbi:MAG TPA: galactokinase [Verrucomicrobiae bacterium]|nr:galactokinase [Verrucomicrobiae bacterium]